MMMKQLLYVENEEALGNSLKKAFGNCKTQITVTKSLAHAAQLISVTLFDLILMDVTINEEKDGIRLINMLREKHVFTPVCFITNTTAESLEEELFNQNCLKIISKTLDVDKIIREVDEALYLATEAMPRFYSINKKLSVAKKFLGNQLLKMP